MPETVPKEGEKKGQVVSFSRANLDSIAAGFFPSIVSIYPEYISDPAIFQCPSDLNPPKIYWESGPRKGEPCVNSVVDNEFGQCEDGCMNGVGASYAYMGWVIDKAEDSDPKTPVSGAADEANEIAELVPPDPECEPERAAAPSRHPGTIRAMDNSSADAISVRSS